jgi:alpha-mannosidase
MLKAGFTPLLKNARATYEIPFGSVERVADGREVPALQWADLSDGEYGISILSDTKHGFDAQGNTLRLTLIRTSYEPDPVPDCGVHSFTYSLYPHSGGWREADTVRRGCELNHGLLVCPVGSKGERLPASLSFIRIHAKENNIVATCLKKAEGDENLILRLYECKGLGTTASLSFGFKAKRLEEVDLLERPLGKGKASPGTKVRASRIQGKKIHGSAIALKEGKAAVRFKPYEIKTFKIVMSKNAESR